MNYLEQFKYSKDDPAEFGVDLNINNKEKKNLMIATFQIFFLDQLE